MINVTIGNNMKRTTMNISEETTLRQALEQADINYTVGMTSLDGATLQPGELDKSFAQMGITEKCYLLNVVKADCAAAIKIAGKACVVESKYTVDDIALLEKFRPRALKLYDAEKKEVLFAVGMNKQGNGSINGYGVSFAPGTSGAKATVTLMIPENVADGKQWAADTIGVAILHLNKVENQIPDALAEVKTEKENVAAAITVC